jgi:hypothetical protein
MQAGVPMVSAIGLDGPGVDAAAADKHATQSTTGLAKAAACGAPGPEWDPIEGIAAAGFQKFTSSEPIQDAPPDKEPLYGTHCFSPDMGTLTLQMSVVPRSRLRVVLHFAEVYWQEPGKRVFDVVVNGVPQARIMCLFADARHPPIKSCVCTAAALLTWQQSALDGESA